MQGISKRCDSYMRIDNAYVKMTDNESTYRALGSKFNKFSWKTSLLKNCL